MKVIFKQLDAQNNRTQKSIHITMQELNNVKSLHIIYK